MSRYIRIASRFWTDEKIIKLSEQEKFLYLYILTSPHSNMLGFYVLPKLYAMHDLGWNDEQFTKPFTKLLEKGLINHDETTSVILIPNFLRYNPIQNINQAKGAAKALQELPDNPLFPLFFQYLKRFAEPFMKPFQKLLPERYGNTETETEAETETEEIYICAPDGARAHTRPEPDSDGSVEAEEVTATSEDKQSKSGPRSPFKSKRQEQLFDEFWTEYPKKRSKGQAEKTWVKIKPDEQLFQNIMDGLRRAKKSVDWQKEGGKYVPYPSTWLNAKGWEDEYNTAEVSSNATYRGRTPESTAFGNAVQVKNRFAGLARDGGTGRVIGGQACPNTGGNSTSPGDTGEGAGGNEGHKITTGMPMAR